MTLRFGPQLASALAALALAVGFAGAPATARDGFVLDGAGMLSPTTIAELNRTIGDFSQQTHKEVVVVTVPSLDGATIQEASEKAFAQQSVNGVLIYLAKAERKDAVIPDRAAAAFFPSGTTGAIQQAMRGYFRSSDFDTGITTGVNLILDQYRSHERGLAVPVRQPAPVTTSQSYGGAMSLFWLILILLAGFLVIRALFRAMAGPRMMPPGAGPGTGPGYGPGPGYGGGYGGGGGGFFSGLLGGLGGAFIGNELFGRGNNMLGGGGGENLGGFGPGGAGQDASGWQPDAGQADASNASSGDFGGGGGFDGGGGGFDGGGGGDSGGW
jgi:uncharacterized protein